MPSLDLPGRPPFAIRARILTPLAAGGTAHEPDGVAAVDDAGRLGYVGPASGAPPDALASAIDLRPFVLMPGLVDTHAHLPQLPNAGLGFALDLLTWLDRLTFPTERSWSDPSLAERLAPAIFRAFAAAGTTTVLAYGVVYEAAMDVAFRAAEAHGIRAILGKVMMDRLTYDPTIEPSTILDRSLRESASLIERWHGAADGRLGYAVTPRFAVSCTAELLRESAALARSTGTWWQSHISEDRGEIAEVGRQFPDAIDYLDVYDRAGALGERSVLAHAIHLSDRELARIVETGTRVSHCPASNLFIGAGVMPLARWLEAGVVVGLGSDVSGGPDPSIFGVMRVGAMSQMGLRVMGHETRPPLAPLDWLRLGTIDGARALGLDGAIGSLEAGKEADLIVVDPSMTSPLRGAASEEPALLDEPGALVSRLIFRAHPDMVRGAWVRGRLFRGTFMIEARFGHVNVIARDWRLLSDFYQRVFGCVFVPPERDLGGPVLEAGTGVPGATIRGVHLRLPGLGEDGPTLEIFQYGAGPERPATAINRPGFGHIAFAVPDVAAAREAVLAEGGGVIGEVVTTGTSDGRRVTWTYLTDPEGNILEIQAWSGPE